MRAIVLASGPPNPGTPEQPPCMTPLGGRPLLHWQVDALRAARVSDIVVVRGYRRTLVEAPGVRLHDHANWAEGGEIECLRGVRRELRGPTMLVSGEALVPVATVRAAMGCPGNVSAVCRILSTQGDPRFLGNESPSSVALVHLSPAGSDTVRELLIDGDGPPDYPSTLAELLTLLQRGGTPVRLVGTNSPWVRGTSPTDLRRAVDLLARGKVASAAIRTRP